MSQSRKQCHFGDEYLQSPTEAVLLWFAARLWSLLERLVRLRSSYDHSNSPPNWGALGSVCRNTAQQQAAHCSELNSDKDGLKSSLRLSPTKIPQPNSRRSYFCREPIAMAWQEFIWQAQLENQRRGKVSPAPTNLRPSRFFRRVTLTYPRTQGPVSSARPRRRSAAANASRLPLLAHPPESASAFDRAQSVKNKPRVELAADHSPAGAAALATDMGYFCGQLVNSVGLVGRSAFGFRPIRHRIVGRSTGQRWLYN